MFGDQSFPRKKGAFNSNNSNFLAKFKSLATKKFLAKWPLNSNNTCFLAQYICLVRK
ncbi:hypothetical protein RHMOL_Rhmol01G0258600 [Rhododendron molle]|uniref:Uncharacterized protein n=1 Tax=Rhododendron molle TaxID=49168 RepID=A0ACC0Q855_RHOML|nr:hypothetical protein RHMOL_Rhmol01G0258600 [Rhododendron molle]